MMFTLSEIFKPKSLCFFYGCTTPSNGNILDVLCIILYGFSTIQIQNEICLETFGSPLEFKVKSGEFQQCLAALNEFVMIGPQAAQ